MEDRAMIEGMDATDAEGIRGKKIRSIAGKTLAIFIALMAILTWSGKMLEEMTIALVTSTTPQRGALDKQFTASGKLTAGKTMPVLAEDAARVTDVYVQAGATVASGDPLFAMDYTDILKAAEDAVDAAADGVASAQQAFDWLIADMSTSTYNRVLSRIDAVNQLDALLQETTAGGVQEAIDKARAEYEFEKLKLDQDVDARNYIQKKDALDKAKQTLDDAQAELTEDRAQVDANNIHTVVADLSGSVTAVNVSVGAMAQTSSSAMLLCDQSAGLSLTVQVDEDAASELQVGDAAKIAVGAVEYSAAIQSIAPAPDQTDAYDVGFLLPGDAGSVGQSATMRVSKRTQSYDVLIPLNALHSDSDGDFVYVIEQTQGALGAQVNVRRVDVYVIDQDGGRAALQTGAVSQKDTIVARSDRAIADGDRVRVGE